MCAAIREFLCEFDGISCAVGRRHELDVIPGVKGGQRDTTVCLITGGDSFGRGEVAAAEPVDFSLDAALQSGHDNLFVLFFLCLPFVALF